MTAAVICLDCRHMAEAHAHHRSGSDCAFCACPRLHRPSLLAQLRGLGWLVGLLLAVGIVWAVAL